MEWRCTYKCGDWRCGSYQFNLYKHDIDQGGLCDVHYWQDRAQKAETVDTEPTAEDWIILRCIYGWIKATKGLPRDPEQVKVGEWFMHKLGKQTVLDMVDQVKLELEKEEQE